MLAANQHSKPANQDVINFYCTFYSMVDQQTSKANSPAEIWRRAGGWNTPEGQQPER